MPRIHIIGHPTDLYRYKTFVNTVLNNRHKWGLSVSFRPRTGGFFKRNFHRLIDLSCNIVNIAMSDYVYIPPMTIGYDPFINHQFTIARLFRKKVIAEFYISMYDTFVNDRHECMPDSEQARKYLEIDRKLNCSYRAIYLNRTEATRYRSINHLPLADNCVIIPLSILERGKAHLNYYRGKSSVFNMVWWGTYIPLHGLDKLILTVKELIKTDKDIHFWILGNSEELSVTYRKIIDRENLNDYISIRNDITFSNGKMEKFLIENCDLAFGAFGDSDKAKTVILNKTIEAMGMKIPVLTQESVAFREYFDESAISYCENNIQDMAARICSIKNMSSADIDAMTENAYRIFRREFSTEASEKKYEALLDSLQ